MDMELDKACFVVLLLLSVFVSVRTENCNTDNCYATNGYSCNDHGSCDCGTCTCDAPYKGLTCEECPTCPTPCEVFKGCVGCKIFGTGFIGIMECLTRCDYVANYIPVDKEQFDVEDDMSDHMLCKHTNEDMCVESFKIGGMTGGYRDLYVRTEVECMSIEVPTFPTYIPETTPVVDESTFMPIRTTEAKLSMTTTLKIPTKTGNPTTVVKPKSTDSIISIVMTKTKTIIETTPEVVTKSNKHSPEVETGNAPITTEKIGDSSGTMDPEVVSVNVDLESADDFLPESAVPASGTDNLDGPSSGAVGSRSNFSVMSTVLAILSFLCFVCTARISLI